MGGSCCLWSCQLASVQGWFAVVKTMAFLQMLLEAVPFELDFECEYQASQADVTDSRPKHLHRSRWPPTGHARPSYQSCSLDSNRSKSTRTHKRPNRLHGCCCKISSQPASCTRDRSIVAGSTCTPNHTGSMLPIFEASGSKAHSVRLPEQSDWIAGTRNSTKTSKTGSLDPLTGAVCEQLPAALLSRGTSSAL